MCCELALSDVWSLKPAFYAAFPQTHSQTQGYRPVSQNAPGCWLIIKLFACPSISPWPFFQLNQQVPTAQPLPGNWLLVRALLLQTNWIITPKVASMSRPHLPEFCLFIVVAAVVLEGPYKR